MSKVRYTYPDPYLSLWQSAAAEVARKHASVARRTASSTLENAPAQPLPPLMDAVDRIGVSLLEKRQLMPENLRTAVAAPPSLRAERRDSPIAMSVAGDCTETAAKFLLAEITRNHQQAAIYAAELKDSVCDPGWGECLAEYLAFKASGGDFPYRANMNPVFNLDANATIAIIGDWGTGQDVAINLLTQVKNAVPDVVIHLGDIYYSGTQTEVQENFLSICQTVFGAGIPVYSLCGNHDMYSGGNGYYWLVDQLKQQASYFCLQNANWQFLAMDTGHNDNNPFTVVSNMTSLNPAEAQWHANKIQHAGGRKNVLLSHHQLFSPFGSVGEVNSAPYAYNPNLLANFQSLLPQITCWFWGHEHTLAVYDPYMQLQRGRCVGCSAVPVFTDQQTYTPASGLTTYNGAPLPTWNTTAITGNNGTDYNHGYAIMVLNGTTANVDYYQVPILQAAVKVFSETF
ncbi:MAG TPA: metallophosphoesterase [Candidatus Angelobacter sp.]|nr:metallophosphoesterase [Candidatus Angelobacter sp.]